MSKYEKYFAQGWGAMYPPEELIRFVKSASKFSNLKIINSSVLDVGCGIGGCLWYLCKNFKHVTGIDFSKSALKRVPIVANYFGIKKNKFDLALMNFENFDIKNNYDFIVDNRSLCNQSFQNFINSYKYIKTKLKRDGLIYTSFFGKKSSFFKNSIKLSPNEAIVKKGKLKIGGIQVFVNSKMMNKIFNKIGLRVCNYENIIINRENTIYEHHIYYLKNN